MSGRVLVVGSVNVDLVVRTSRLPLPGETVLGGTFSRFHGGKGGNQAVAAARLGVPVMLVAALGDDAFGSEARAALAREGVGVDVLVPLDNVATGVALILVDDKAENQIAVAPGANAGLTATHVRQALVRLNPHAGDAVIVTHEIPTAAAREALRIGREGGAWTILNPAPADGLDRQVLSLADVVVPNRGELARLVADDARRSGRPTSGAEDPVRAARTLMDETSEGPGPREAILVSLGSAGAMLVPRTGRVVDIKAPKVKAVDATGAGDALNGALAAGLAGGLPLETAARRAIVAASLSVTRAGAREGMPSLRELAEALGETLPGEGTAADDPAAARVPDTPTQDDLAADD
jgi:ribokinase